MSTIIDGSKTNKKLTADIDRLVTHAKLPANSKQIEKNQEKSIPN
jgi:hypothetical protein